MNLSALIPAYNPSASFIDYVNELALSEFNKIIIVNDGSYSVCDNIFKEIVAIRNVSVLTHEINLGKGAAIKTGLNHIFCHFPDHVGVVTIDADGQHLQNDALKVGKKLIKHPQNLVLGVRSFGMGSSVPLRSKIGNNMTTILCNVFVGKKITDTQTGLRGIPKSFIPQLLQIKSNGYEFEMDMILACSYSCRGICEQKISTIYFEGNSSSHFDPIIDSMKIFFVLCRFSMFAMVTGCFDYLKSYRR